MRGRQAHVGILQGLDVGVDACNERGGYRQEGAQLLPLESVHFNRAAHPEPLDDEPRREELREQHKAGRRQVVDRQLVHHEHERRARAVPNNGERVAA